MITVCTSASIALVMYSCSIRDMAGATFLAQFGKKLIHGLVLLCMTVAECDSSWLAHGKIDPKFRSAQEENAPDGLPFDPLLWTLMMMDLHFKG